MLNPFPELLTYGILAPFIIRFALGIYFLLFGYSLALRLYEQGKKQLTTGHFLAFFSILGGLSVFLGFYTQIGALILVLLSTYLVYIRPQRRKLYFLLIATAVSLLFSGAGAFAFDFPL